MLEASFNKVEADHYLHMFNKCKDQIIKRFLKDRTGILSPNESVRKIAANVLICLGTTGFLNHLLPQVGPILNYKPIEMLDKLETLLQAEMDKIPHFQLMYYSEITKDLFKIYNTKDDDSIKKALGIQAPIVEE